MNSYSRKMDRRRPEGLKRMLAGFNFRVMAVVSALDGTVDINSLKNGRGMFDDARA